MSREQCSEIRDGIRCRRPSEGRGLCKSHYVMRRKRDVERGQWITVYTDATPVRNHIRTLRGLGVGLRRIEALSGLARVTIWHISQGHRAQVRNRTAKAILAIPIPAAAHRLASANALVDVTGSRRRVQALSAIGYSNRGQCRLLGLAEGNLSRIFTGAQAKISAERARDIEAIYEQLCMTPGSNQRARNTASKKGWPPPLAWDEDTIDDPAATPNAGDIVRVSFLERYEELVELGYRQDVIAERMGIAVESLERSLYRHGIHPTRVAA